MDSPMWLDFDPLNPAGVDTLANQTITAWSVFNATGRLGRATPPRDPTPAASPHAAAGGVAARCGSAEISRRECRSRVLSVCPDPLPVGRYECMKAYPTLYPMHFPPNELWKCMFGQCAAHQRTHPPGMHTLSRTPRRRWLPPTGGPAPPLSQQPPWHHRPPLPGEGCPLPCPPGTACRSCGRTTSSRSPSSTAGSSTLTRRVCFTSIHVIRSLSSRVHPLSWPGLAVEETTRFQTEKTEAETRANALDRA